MYRTANGYMEQMTSVDFFLLYVFIPFCQSIGNCIQEACTCEDIKLAFRQSHLVPFLERGGKKTYQTNSGIVLPKETDRERSI